MARAAKAGRNAAEVDKIQNKNLPNRKYKNKIQKMQLQDMWDLPMISGSVLKCNSRQSIFVDDSVKIYKKPLKDHLGKGAKKCCKKCGLMPNLPTTPPPNPVWSFSDEKITPYHFFLEWAIAACKNFYTWSHLKILIFDSVIFIYICPKTAKIWYQRGIDLWFIFLHMNTRLSIILRQLRHGAGGFSYKSTWTLQEL